MIWTPTDLIHTNNLSMRNRYKGICYTDCSNMTLLRTFTDCTERTFTILMPTGNANNIRAMKFKQWQQCSKSSHIQPASQSQLFYEMKPVVGKIKSRFDLNRDFRHIVIRFKPQKIRFDCLRLEIWFDLLFLEIQFGPKWFGYESRSSPGIAEWSDMPRSIFSTFTASSRASLPPLDICNGEDNLYLM